MTYYGVSVLITILVTSLVAFYLLYKAKEFNLGIVISISIGSIILGFTLSPVFKKVLHLLNNNININPKVVFVIAIVIVLFVFLLFILIVSFLISLLIPKKLASIDCGLVVDRIISKIKIKDGIINISGKMAGSFRKISSNMQKMVNNVYNLINKLKKPVDTNQIIDTMGIEKNENNILKEKSFYTIETPDTVAFANLIAYMEPSAQVAYTDQNSSAAVDHIDQNIETIDNEFENLVTVAYQEIATTHMSDIETNEVDENELNTLPEIIVEDIVTESKIIESNVVESELLETETPEVVELNKTLHCDENSAVEFVIDDNVIDTIEYSEETTELGSIADVDSLVLKALESKDAGRKEKAIEYYIEALQHEPNNEMVFWVVLDVCALYKQLGLSELAKNILDGIVSEYGNAIQPEVKMEIMNHLK